MRRGDGAMSWSIGNSSFGAPERNAEREREKVTLLRDQKKKVESRGSLVLGQNFLLLFFQDVNEGLPYLLTENPYSLLM
jgi:hypothetical protein